MLSSTPSSRTLTTLWAGFSNNSAAAAALVCAEIPVLLPVGVPVPAATPICVSVLAAAAAWAGVLGMGPASTEPVAD
eukprot:7347883-Karenia_brevis.AAC.1